MAAPEFEHIESATFSTLPGVSITGDDPARTLGGTSGDIVHVRHGHVISARSWLVRKSWRLDLPVLTISEIDNLRTFWVDRVFVLWPTGNGGASYSVYWGGEFEPEYVGQNKWSLEIRLQQTVS